MRTVLQLTGVAALAAASGLLAAPAATAPVADSAMAGNRDAVRELLRGGADVNASQGDGMTALHWAAANDDLEMTRMLLYAGASVKAVTRIGHYTPLFPASRNGNPDIVSALLEAGADPLATTNTGVTPLMLAAAAGNPETVNLLTDAGVPVDATESARSQTALMFAAAANREAAVRALLERGADPDRTSAVVDVVALSRESARLRRERSERLAAEREEQERRAAGRAAGSGDDGRTTQQARRGGNGGPNVFSRLFGWITFRGSKKPPPRLRRLSMAQLVGRQGGLTPLLYAARQGHAEAVAALLDGGADVNAVSAGDRTSPLLIATINGHFDVASLLLDRGADPNLLSIAGAGPLYGAINVEWAPHAFYPQPTTAQQQTTCLELMQKLLDHGADPNARLVTKLWYTGYNFDQSGIDEAGTTAFWRAAQATDVEAMRMLVAAGADPTLPSTLQPPEPPGDGNADRELEVDPTALGAPAVTPLQAASGAGYDGNYHRESPAGRLPAVRYLVEELGADVNAADDRGYTPLHNAAFRGDTEMVRYLVSQGADVMAVTKRGQTTADMANGPIQRLQPFPETRDLLVSLGAVNNHKCVSC